MNYRDQVANEVTQAAENSSTNGGNDGYGRSFSDLDQIDVDFDSTPFVKFYPTTAITGTFPDGEGNPVIRFPDESNNGHDHQGYLGLVLDDVSIDTSDAGFDMSDATFVETDDEDYTEYRAVNFADDDTAEKFEGAAVSIDGDQYGIENRTTEIDDRAILVVDRTASVSVAKKLDVAGGVPAGMDPSSDDNINSGLVEYAPDDVDTEVDWRYARQTPELRPELRGSDVTVLISRREEIDDEQTGYLGQDDDSTGPVLGTGGDGTHRDENRASYAELVAADEARGMMWYSVFDEDGNALAPLAGEDAGRSTNRPYLEWTFDETTGRLPDDQWNFVQQYQENDLQDDEETIVKNIRQNFEDADEDRIVELIQNDAGQ